jgi:hypothetical protein
MDNEKRLHELEFIRSRSADGILQAEDVVEFARDERTALHGEFEWNDDAAAHQHRLWQARQLIRLTVTVVDSPAGQQTVRMYASCDSDRVQPGGGYRSLVEVMGNEELREQLLSAAFRELRTVRRKYQQLRELQPIFRAIDKAERKTVEKV